MRTTASIKPADFTVIVHDSYDDLTVSLSDNTRPKAELWMPPDSAVKLIEALRRSFEAHELG